MFFKSLKGLLCLKLRIALCLYFDLTAEEVYARKAQGYEPMSYYKNNRELKGVIDRIKSGYFSHGDQELFRPIVDSLLYDDQYMLLADYQSYADC
nr:glycogen/starch/alpha-glucan phosphorylase [Microcystis aeruginosa L311-01]